MDISHGNTEPCWWPLLNDIYPLRLYRGVANVSYVHNKQYRIFSCRFSKKTWSLVEKYDRTNFNAFRPWSNCRESCKPVLLQIMAWCQNDTEPILKTMITQFTVTVHDDVIKWKHFPSNWPFVRGIHRSPVNSTHKGQWRGALMFSSICVWIYDWVNNRQAGDLRRYRLHYFVIVMDMPKEARSHQLSFCIRIIGYGHAVWQQRLIGLALIIQWYF